MRKTSLVHAILVPLLSVTLQACGENGVLDAKAPESFKSSVQTVAKTLPESERAGFLANLTLVVQSEGSISLQQPSLSALIVLDGKKPAEVQVLAEQVRLAERRRELSYQLPNVERELKKLRERLAFTNDSLQEHEEAQKRLRNVVVSEIVAGRSSGRSPSTQLSFQLENKNSVPIQIRGVELEVRAANGMSVAYGTMSMVGIVGSGCLYGQQLVPGLVATASCVLSLEFEPAGQYTLRVAEIDTPGQKHFLWRSFSPTTLQKDAADLMVEIALKATQVEQLQSRLSSLE